MAKYDSLNRFFRAQAGSLLRMTFDQVEREAGFTLPASARLHQAWWANDRARHVQAKAWLDAGFESEQVDMKGQTLVFKRITSGGLRPGRHPAIGALKGTFSVDPNWDPASPAMSEEDLAEMEANIHRTADMVDAGRKGMSENAPAYKHAETEPNADGHPLIGWMKGTFSIEPGTDLTKPALDPDELAQMFANIERTADLIERGLKRR